MSRFTLRGKLKWAVASLALAGMLGAAVAAPSSDPRTPRRIEKIKRLAAEAYVWGLAAEFTYRFTQYNTIVNTPINTLTYVSYPAAWNNSATNAGDSSVIYINGFTDFTQARALVLTVPPSADHYFVVNYLDAFINTIGSIGMRTTPTLETTNYLLVGPDSPYAKKKFAVIDGRTLPVLASDTNLNWMLIRIAANTLADSVHPQSVASTFETVSKKFALTPLDAFRRNGFKPVYPTTYDDPPPTPSEIARAAPWKDTPTLATRFFEQLGAALVKSPLPDVNTALGGTAVKRLPAYVVPQYGATTVYLPPSYGQARTLRHFAPIGLSEKGFRIPKDWGPAERAALQEGLIAGKNYLNTAIGSTAPGASTNYWTILNSLIGTYPNTENGYLIRSIIVLNGGSANIPLDAVYPNVGKYDGVNQLDGNANYTLTFTPPPATGAQLPVIGSFPPQVLDLQGKIKGFWSVIVYQPDDSEVSAPFLTQAAVLNTSYTSGNEQVASVDATNDTVTVVEPTWGQIVESAPLLFKGSNAATCGLDAPSGVYYVASTPVEGTQGQLKTYTFKVSQTWQQELSTANVPVQYSGVPGPLEDLVACDTSSNLGYGVVRAVSQLGSNELEDGKLKLNNDGSLTLFIGSTPPSNPDFLPNWLPAPSTAYYDSVYGTGSNVSTELQVILRTYYPTPGNEPPSILPYTAGNMPETYLPPPILPVVQ